MKTLCYILLALSIISTINAQNCNVLYDDYSSAQSWTKFCPANVNQIGILMKQVNYWNSVDGHEERLYRSLPTSFNANDDWEIKLDFRPDSGGNFSWSGHLPLSITAGALDPLSNCNDPTNCSPSSSRINQNQDGFIVFFGTLPPNLLNVSSRTFFQLHIKDGRTEINSRTNFGQIINAVLGNDYQLVLKKCGQIVSLDVLSNGIPLPGSPIQYIIPSTFNITGLNTIQHANSARGISSRKLYARVDNLCVSRLTNSPPILSGIGNPNSSVYSYKLYTCASNQCFNIFATDPDIGQNLTISPKNALPLGSTFQSSSGGNPIGTFCWDPSSSDVGVHYLTFEVQDDHCNAMKHKVTYTIEVIDGYDLGGAVKVCNNAAPLALPDPGPGIWKIISPITGILPSNIFDPVNFLPGKYVLSYCTPKQGYVSKCSGCWNIEIEVLASPKINFPALESFCDTDPPFQFNASPLGGVWSGGPYISSTGLFTPAKANPYALGGNPVTYTVVANNGCFATKTMNIPVYQNGSSQTIDLGTYCLDEYLILPSGGYRYELIEVTDLNTGKRPTSFPTLPLSLPGNAFHPAQFPNYLFGGANIQYTFKAYHKTPAGCEYSVEYLVQLVSCACLDEVAQYLNINATTSNNLYYNFSFTPLISSLTNLVRINWVITDQWNNTIKSLYSWNSISNQPPNQSFIYDFTSEYGNLFFCGTYHLYLQLITEDSLGNKSLCQAMTPIFICDYEDSGHSIQDGKESTEKDDNELKGRIYPIPTSGKTFLEIEQQKKSDVAIQIVNILGNVIYSGSNDLPAGISTISIDCSGFEPGIYIVKLSNGSDQKSIKLLTE